MRPTGSKVHRAWKCPASAVLPQGYASSDPSPAALRGTAIHAFLEQVGRVGRGAALAAAPADVVPLLEALDLDNLPVGLATEVSFAWNWQDSTARELGRNLPRREDGGVDYDHPSIQPPVDWSCEIPLTIDVMGVAFVAALDVNRGYVGDYKSGHSKYPAPDMFGQTLLAALCVAKVYGCDDVVVELLHIHDNGGHHAVRRTVNEWDLQAFEAELRHSMLAIASGRDRGFTPPPVEGTWCDHCPAFRSCPAKLALVRAIPQELVQLGVRPDPESGALTLTPGSITVRNVAAAWMMKEAIEGICARIAEECCSVAAFEQIPLPDGRVLGRIITERRGLNGKVAAELLRERLGPAAAEYIEESVTLDALRKAVAKHRRPGEKIETKAGDGVYQIALAEIEQRGGLELKVTDAVRPHVPKRKPG
ncbi:MAG TPA: PD-(D/E)XK nuclease family protein [Gemmatimonadaceae bacterium]|nr:PD-(D/E)XK nuclease family protein [Gemmatimonadaceae bacterium]